MFVNGKAVVKGGGGLNVTYHSKPVERLTLALVVTGDAEDGDPDAASDVSEL
jgi:hypothetical protein